MLIIRSNPPTAIVKTKHQLILEKLLPDVVNRLAFISKCSLQLHSSDRERQLLLMLVVYSGQ
jgi:hypothetical protein